MVRQTELLFARLIRFVLRCRYLKYVGYPVSSDSVGRYENFLHYHDSSSIRITNGMWKREICSFQILMLIVYPTHTSQRGVQVQEK